MVDVIAFWAWVCVSLRKVGIAPLFLVCILVTSVVLALDY